MGEAKEGTSKGVDALRVVRPQVQKPPRLEALTAAGRDWTPALREPPHGFGSVTDPKRTSSASMPTRTAPSSATSTNQMTSYTGI